MCPSSPIHADLHPGVHQQARVLRAGEVAALVAVPDARGMLPQRPTRGSKHEADVQRLVQLPADHVARIPIEHRHSAEPALRQPDVGDLDTPPTITRVRGHATPPPRVNTTLSPP